VPKADRHQFQDRPFAAAAREANADAQIACPSLLTCRAPAQGTNETLGTKDIVCFLPNAVDRGYIYSTRIQNT
jgi:hypothetical protein